MQQVGHGGVKKGALQKRIAEVLLMGSLRSNLKKIRQLFKIRDEFISVSYTELVVVASQPR